MSKVHLLVEATEPMDFFPTACGIRDTCPNNASPLASPTTVNEKEVTCAKCKKCLAHRPAPRTRKGNK